MSYYSCLFLVLGTKPRDSDVLDKSSSCGATSSVQIIISHMGLLKEFKVKFMFNSQQRIGFPACTWRMRLPCVPHVRGVGWFQLTAH